jgi:hypothetical protein
MPRHSGLNSFNVCRLHKWFLRREPHSLVFTENCGGLPTRRYDARAVLQKVDFSPKH